jgi:copper chaperone CopZ
MAETYNIGVSDMKCNGCEDTIQNELRHASGITRVSANHIEGTVEVEGSDHVDREKLAGMINELGFTAE